MANVNSLTGFLSDVANAIREKDGIAGNIYPKDYDNRIRNIPTGGGGYFNIKYNTISSDTLYTNSYNSYNSLYSDLHDNTNIKYVDLFGGQLDLNSYNNLMGGCSNLISFKAHCLETNATNSFISFFYNDYNLQTFDMSSLNMKNIKDLGWLCFGCSNLQSIENIANWDTRNVIRMKSAFCNCFNLADPTPIEQWSFENVTDISWMLSYVGVNQYNDYRGYNLNLSNKNFNKLTNLYCMFYYSAAYDVNLCGANLCNVKDMSWMFAQDKRLHGNYSYYDGDTTYGYYYMNFAGCNVYNLQNTSHMFMNCTEVQGFNFTGWNPINLIDTSYMFYNCQGSFRFDGVENWKMTNVTSLAYMFYSCSASRRTNSKPMTMNLYNWNVSNVTNLAYTFYRARSMTTFNAVNWDTRKVTNICYIFDGFKDKINAINALKSWNLNQVINAKGFLACSSSGKGDPVFNELNWQNWNLPNVTDMSEIFRMSTTNLIKANFSNWNMPKVTTYANAFESCCNLTDLNASNWKMENVQNIYNIFTSCFNLTNLNVDNWHLNNYSNSLNSFFGMHSASWQTWNITKLSTQSIISVINMCINAINIPTGYKNISNLNIYSPFYNSNINVATKVNSTMLSRLTAAGWTY